MGMRAHDLPRVDKGLRSAVLRKLAVDSSNIKEPREEVSGLVQGVAAPPGLIQLTYEEFAAALKDALRNYNRSDLLLCNPLLQSRQLARRTNASPAALKALLTETADALFTNDPRDQKLRRVLELSYFRPAPKQEAAAERLGLAFSTYRRLLATAHDRIARWLWKGEEAEPTRVPRLSIVVLPFTNLSSDDSQDHLIDGITENLTTNLSRIPDMFVIGRNTAFHYRDKSIDIRAIGQELVVRYVMTGSVQLDGNRIRVNAQLNEAETRLQLWAERFDKPRASLLDLQDEITAHLARSVDLELVAAESRRVMHEGGNEFDSLDLVLRARAVWNEPFSSERTREARRLFEAALRLDPKNVVALLGLADTHMREVNSFQSQDRPEQIRIADDAVSRALALAPDSAHAHFSRGAVLTAMRAPERALREFDLAIDLDGNLALAHGARGLIEIYLGRAEAAETHVSRAIRLNPRDPGCATWHLMIGTADLFLGRLDQAVGRLRRSVELNPNCGWAQLSLAVALSLAGRAEEAAGVSAVARRVASGFTISKHRREAMSDNPIYVAQRERFCAGLRQIGVPEN
jgi:TolB-like protein/Flp pilus assembly protein TadD